MDEKEKKSDKSKMEYCIKRMNANGLNIITLFCVGLIAFAWVGYSFEAITLFAILVMLGLIGAILLGQIKMLAILIEKK